MPRKSALQLDPRNSAEVDVEQQACCRLRAAVLEQGFSGGERPAFDAVVYSIELLTESRSLGMRA